MLGSDPDLARVIKDRQSKPEVFQGPWSWTSVFRKEEEE